MSCKHILLEICVDSLADAVAAAEAGADRLEVCSALSLGGLTPSSGVLAGIRQCVEVPYVVMIRPREAGFCYSDAEFVTMCRDAELAGEMGAAGIVFGILNAEGRIDEPRCRQLREIADGREAVFHRAFDVVREPLVALETLVDLGFTRILTSGQARTAVEGEERIRQFIEQSRGRIEILPGGGLNEQNIVEFLGRTGCDQVHMGLSSEREDQSIAPDCVIRFASPPVGTERMFRGADPQRVRLVVERLALAGERAAARSAPRTPQME
jgi:copper homeostasis protein